MGLLILRCVFLMVAAGLGILFIRTPAMPPDAPGWAFWSVFGGALGLAMSVIILDVAIRRKRLDAISAVYFGMVVGLFLSYVVGIALTPVPMSPTIRDCVQLVLGAVLCYACISLLIQTRNDFRFIIPYVEFSKEIKGLRPYILDTSVIIDGRIADLVDTNLFDSQLIMPRFVIGELQGIADSSDRQRRGRGRRGLDIVNRLRTNPKVDLKISDHELPELEDQPVDLKLVALAKHLDGKLVTNDFNLNKVASLQGVVVINLNDVANALKPVFLPGENMQVRIVKSGEEPGQGVGYMDDGTMVVVEGGREHLNQVIAVAVTSVLQTSAGRMVFGRLASRTSQKL